MSRWTDLAVWHGPTINEGDGDGTPGEAADHLASCRGFVVHIASGFYQGTIDWQHNPAADVSSHFVVARDGRVAQCVDTADRAWTQRAGNSDWLSVECEGFALDDGLHASHPGWERLTDAQIQAIARLLVRGHQQYGYPLQLAGSPDGRGLGYHSMGAEHGYNWGHLHCPGEPIKAQLPAILARAKQIAQPKPAGRVEDTMWQGVLLPGAGAVTLVCTPWDKSVISFGADCVDEVWLRVAEHVVPGPGRPAGWTIKYVKVGSADAQRVDLDARVGVDRRSIVRVSDSSGTALHPEDPRVDAPIGYLAWLV
jgi:hypothetical protein